MIKQAVILLLWLISAPLFGGDKLGAVSFNKIPGDGSAVQESLADLSDYGIAIHSYWPEKEYVEQTLKRINAKEGLTLTWSDWIAANSALYRPIDNTFLSDLEASQLLYVGQATHDSAGIPFSRYPEAIKRFLERGGTIMFDYGSISPVLNGFLKSVQVANPSAAYADLKAGYYSAIPWKDSLRHPLLNTPCPIRSDREILAFGWWEKWTDQQSAPFRSRTQPEQRAALLIQENVLGKGKIIFNQIAEIFKGAGGQAEDLKANILTYILSRDLAVYKTRLMEERGGPGEPAK